MAKKCIIARAWGKGIDVIENGKKIPLKNWYSIDFANWRDTGEGFVWGYEGTGPHVTAYSILREFYGKETALQFYHAFALAYLSKLPEEKGFSLTLEELGRIVDEAVRADGGCPTCG